MSGAQALERGYRRLLAWYPTWHRQAHGEEMIGVLLAAAPGDRRRPGLGETLNIIWAGLLIRLRPRATALPSGAWPDALAVFSVAAPVALTCLAIAWDLERGASHLAGCRRPRGRFLRAWPAAATGAAAPAPGRRRCQLAGHGPTRGGKRQPHVPRRAWAAVRLLALRLCGRDDCPVRLGRASPRPAVPDVAHLGADRSRGRLRRRRLERVRGLDPLGHQMARSARGCARRS